MEQQLKKFKISYFYLATGMEGQADEHPEKIIEAPTKEMALFIYHLMFFVSEKYGEGYATCNYKTFLKKSDTEKYWGITIKEILP